MVKVDTLTTFFDSMGRGAWPFLVGGAIGVIKSVNERNTHC